MAKKTGGTSFTASMRPAHARVLTGEAVEFVASLHRTFDAERRRLLAIRAERRKAFDGGALPDFLAATAAIRAGDWKIAPLPPDLRDRRVEITGPTDRKMII
ncbi:MAG: malate synthase A, partial [Alphaproteobacteria bacterium]|nr:malate synthase A [Alphaproteobacteria bacterium]